MNNKLNRLLLTLLTISTLNAKNTTLTNISFNMDNEGNLNPNIFIPKEYGDENQFYSAIAYSSSQSQEVEVLEKFSDSKNAVISSSQELTLNYITYTNQLFNYPVSIGLQSSFEKVEKNEFGYIYDKENFFGKGTDYYTSFDDNLELDIQRHSINADIIIPIGKYFTSKFFVSISPYTTIGVKQSTLFKPFVSEKGISKSTTLQDISYKIRYDGVIKTETFFDIGFVAYYDKQPLKYDIAQINAEYLFETNRQDTEETTTFFLVKLLLDIDIMGELKPSIGYAIEKLDVKDNISGETVSRDKSFLSIGFERIF